MDSRIISRAIPGLLCAGLISACSSSDDNGSGTLSVSLMDRPVDGVTELWVTISEMWLKPAGDGPAFELPLTNTPIQVNLLDLTDQTAELLVDEAVVDAGSYNWIELRVEDADVGDSYAITDIGGMEPVDIDVPSGKIKLVSGFSVGDNQAIRLLIDWDVRKGLTDPVGREGYLLRPAFRVLDVDELGSVSGTITQTTFDLEDSCTAKSNADEGNVVYVFEGDVTPDDIDDVSPDPVTTVDAIPGVDGGYDYRFVIEPGDYTIAFTCQGLDDTDEVSEDLVFLSPNVEQPITVVAEAELTDVDF